MNMKAIDFAKILKEVIKREVRTVIREELKEALKPSKQPLRNTVHKAIPKKTPVMQKMTVDPSIPKTGNPGLDAILNETAVSMRFNEPRRLLRQYFSGSLTLSST